MTETMIRRLPDGRWQLTQTHDTALSLGRTLGVLPDLGESVAVDLPKVEAWDGKWRKGDEGLTRGGRPYRVTATDMDIKQPLRVEVLDCYGDWRGVQHGLDGLFLGGPEHGFDLMPPTKRGPANEN